jgi:hypothetical protein
MVAPVPYDDVDFALIVGFRDALLVGFRGLWAPQPNLPEITQLFDITKLQ